MHYHTITTEQLQDLYRLTGSIVANWTQRDGILKILYSIGDQEMPEEFISKHIFGRWN